MSLKYVLILIVVFQTITVLAEGIESLNLPQHEINRLSPIKCKKSKSPLFQGDTTVKIDIMTDMNKYIKRKEFKGVYSSKAVVAIEDAKNELDFIPVIFQTRGNSRLAFCQYRPIRLNFVDQAIEHAIEASIGHLPKSNVLYINEDWSELPAQKTAYLKKYMNAFEDVVPGVDLEPTSQDDNMFDKIGDDVKIVTDCGKSAWKNLGGDTLMRQQDKIIGEYLIYKILEKLKTTTMKARLAEVTYRYLNGQPMMTRYAFFRENRSSIAKRCKLEKKKDENLVEGPNRDKAFHKFHAKFLHKFVYSNDFALYREHNAKYIYRIDGDSYNTVYVPYDFDLSGIMEPYFIKNVGLPLSVSSKQFQGFVQNFANISKEHKLVAYIQVHKVLEKQQVIEELIQGAKLSPAMKNRFMKWHKSYFKVLIDLGKSLSI